MEKMLWRVRLKRTTICEVLDNTRRVRVTGTPLAVNVGSYQWRDWLKRGVNPVGLTVDVWISYIQINVPSRGRIWVYNADLRGESK